MELTCDCGTVVKMEAGPPKGEELVWMGYCKSCEAPYQVRKVAGLPGKLIALICEADIMGPMLEEFEKIEQKKEGKHEQDDRV